MKMIDRTSYRPDERLMKVAPRNYEFITDSDIRFYIHRHKDFPNTWFLGCQMLGLSMVDLNTDSFEEAREVGYERLKIHLRQLVTKYNETIEELSIRPIDVEE